MNSKFVKENEISKMNVKDGNGLVETLIIIPFYQTHIYF